MKLISKFQKPFTSLLLFSILFVFSCSVDDSVTDATISHQLDKPTEIEDYFSNIPPINVWRPSFTNLEKLLLLIDTAEKANLCAFFIYGIPFERIPGEYNNNEDLSKIYNFRDNYLLQSKKGQQYTASYYLLSKYGIENNLMMKHSLEHLTIMETGIEISKELQRGTNNSKIIFNKSTYDECKNIVKIYRNSEKHTEIDPILDYLETDLEKYYNKPKAEIAADFGF